MFELVGFIKAAAVAFAIRPSGKVRDEQKVTTPPPLASGSGEVVDFAAHRAPEAAVSSSSKPPPSAPRKPAVAAERFLAWLDDEGYAVPGQELYWSNSPTYPYRDPHRPGTEVGIWELYQWHCKDENTISIPETRLAEALGRLCQKRLVRDYSSGKLRRPTVYRVPDSVKPTERPRCRAA